MTDDLIRRSDAIEFAKYTHIASLNEEERVAWIMNIPTAEPKRGEWVGEGDGYYNGELIYDTWYCSNCDYVVDDEEPPTWNFCPNCGADMREREGE